MNLKKSSIVFLLVLLVILVFILGVRQGQRVEKTNKIIDYLISIPPSSTVQPTDLPLEFKSYKHEGCRIEFLYPSFLKKESESSVSARLEGNFQSIEFDCAKNSADKLLNVKDLATIEVKLKDRSFKGKIRPDKRTEEDAGPTLLLNISNTRTGKNIFFEVSKSIYPLFEKSLEFVQ